MNYLELLKNKKKAYKATARTAKSPHTPLLSVLAVPLQGIFEKNTNPSCSSCSDDTEHISENIREDVPDLHADLQEQATIIDGLHPCGLCGGILFNEGDRGGYFCVECQTLPSIVTVNRVVRGITPRKPKKETLFCEPSCTVFRKDNRRPSPTAIEWLMRHRKALLEKGWTLSELFSRKKSSTSLAFLDLWERAFFAAYLHEDGCVEFECSINARDFFQTCRPRSMAAMKSAAPTKTISEVKI